MSISPLRSILKKGNSPIGEVEIRPKRGRNFLRFSFRRSSIKDESSVKTSEVKTEESFKKRLRNSLRFSFRRSSIKDESNASMSSNSGLPISSSEKSRKKVTFKLEEDYLHMKPVLANWEKSPKTWEERIQQWEERTQQWIREEEESKLKKKEKFRSNHSYYQYMKDFNAEEEYQNSEISFK